VESHIALLVFRGHNLVNGGSWLLLVAVHAHHHFIDLIVFAFIVRLSIEGVPLPRLHPLIFIILSLFGFFRVGGSSEKG